MFTEVTHEHEPAQAAKNGRLTRLTTSLEQIVRKFLYTIALDSVAKSGKMDNVSAHSVRNVQI